MQLQLMFDGDLLLIIRFFAIRGDFQLGSPKWKTQSHTPSCTSRAHLCTSIIGHRVFASHLLILSKRCALIPFLRAFVICALTSLTTACLRISAESSAVVQCSVVYVCVQVNVAVVVGIMVGRSRRGHHRPGPLHARLRAALAHRAADRTRPDRLVSYMYLLDPFLYLLLHVRYKDPFLSVLHKTSCRYLERYQ